MIHKKNHGALLAALLTASFALAPFSECVYATESTEKVPEVTLRVCNWEEYIDLGEWEEDEVIDLDSGDIFGENSMVEDFEEWYYETYGIRVHVEYSTFGTNEDLYNMLTLGDVYDVICPSEYMFMKLQNEGMLVPLSDDFFDETIEENYYIKGVSPFIEGIFEENDIDGVSWNRFAAGFMWGITGFVYNPDLITEEEASTYTLMSNSDYRRQITVKDNVRDTYFEAVGAIKRDLLISDDFINDPDYKEKLKAEMNDVSDEMIAQVQDYLQNAKDYFYSFETDSGKADMITGRVAANYQWSGDAVYTMDQAEEDDYYLNFAVPEESTNIYFDGWVMLKKGIEENALKQHAAEAWINFVSRPDNAVRNMYYIGYTSVISGGEDSRILEYLEWNYGAEEDEEEVCDYDVSYFFTDSEEDAEDYILTVPEEQTYRQLFAQYPDSDTVARTSIMIYFNPEVNAKINQMWINIRCYNIHQVPAWAWITAAIVLILLVIIYIRAKKMDY